MQGVIRWRAKRKTRKSFHMLPGVQRMWENEHSHSQVNSHVGSWNPKWTPKSLERNCRGQNPSPLKSTHEVMCLQSRGSPSCGNFRTSIWESRDKKAIWMWPLWRAIEYIIKGKVMASPKSGLWWVLWVRGCPWLILASKVLQLCTNHPKLVLCTFVWIIEACQLFLVPSRNSSRPLYPSKCYKPRSSPDSLLFRCFQFGTHIWVPQGVGSASQIPNSTPDHNSLKNMGQMKSDWNVLYTVGNIFSKAIRCCPCHLNIGLI
jgi:hypothetical protein